LDSAGFPAVVTAHFVPMEGQQRPRTTILIKFAEEVRITLFPFPFTLANGSTKIDFALNSAYSIPVLAMFFLIPCLEYLSCYVKFWFAAFELD
jgi:hypothetical protein